jgi:hypothetical protein
MFVRFRERKSGGARPALVQAQVLCRGGCMNRYGHRAVCFMKPRCRWHIGTEHDLELEPYRLLVSIIENRRVDGKIQQEHIADLGAVDGHLMPAFYTGIDPAIVAKITADDVGPALRIERAGLVFLCRNWARASLESRVDFWQNLHEALSRLANRINTDTASRIMEAINARIPMPTIDECESVPLQRAKTGLANAEAAHASSSELVKANKELAAAAERNVAIWQEDAELQAQRVAAWRTKIDRLS